MDTLAQTLRGKLILPTSPEYDQARKVWNAAIERHPAAIALCSGAADVVKCVNFARDQKMTVAVRGGGHHVAGISTCDNGLVIDLSPIHFVHVQPEKRTAKVGAGATLGEVDHETQAFGLALPMGVNSTTGIAGLTLGGGFGWLSRKFGMTVDHLISADVVLSSGEFITCSEQHHPDLFWALRGGGGNFGVVTAFEFHLVPFGPMMYGGPVVYPLQEAEMVLGKWRDFCASAPEDVTAWVVMRNAPPFPFVPAEHHGKPVIVIATVYTGTDHDEGARALAPLMQLGNMLGQHVGPLPYCNWQKAFDAMMSAGMRNYWKSLNFTELSNPAFATVKGYVSGLISPDTELIIAQLGANTVRNATDTAYPHRNTLFVMNVHTRWASPQDDAKCTEWARKCYDGMLPYSTGGTYVNFSDMSLPKEKMFGPNLSRLIEVKTRYDPTNLFRVNHNIAPKVK